MPVRTIHALVPHADWERRGGRAPHVEGVEFVVGAWGGDEDALPGAAGEVAFYVPPMSDRERSIKVLGDLPALQVVQLMSAGYDWIVDDVPDAITLCSAGDVHSPAVAEWVLAVLLAHVRDLPAFAASAARGRWEPHGTGTLDGAEVVLLGYGSIGRSLRAVLEPLGATVHGVGRAQLDDLPDLLPRAAALVVLTPLSDATRHQVDARLLARLADGAVLVNASRGPVVDPDALLAELRSGRLRAAVDVTDPEPLPDDDPLFTAPGALVTPHVAGAVPTFLPRAYRFVVDQLERYARGEQLQATVDR